MAVVLGIRGKSWKWCNLYEYVISLEMQGPHATTIEQWNDLWIVSSKSYGQILSFRDKYY